MRDDHRWHWPAHVVEAPATGQHFAVRLGGIAELATERSRGSPAFSRSRLVRSYTRTTAGSSAVRARAQPRLPAMSKAPTKPAASCLVHGSPGGGRRQKGPARMRRNGQRVRRCRSKGSRCSCASPSCRRSRRAWGRSMCQLKVTLATLAEALRRVPHQRPAADLGARDAPFRAR